MTAQTQLAPSLTTAATAPAPSVTPPAPDASSRRGAMLGVLLVGQFMGVIDVFIVNVAAPGIGTDLHVTGTGLQLVVGVYIVAYAVLLITGARLGAMFGSSAVFAAGVALFTAASLGCALAPDLLVLVVARAVQGAGAAAMIPQVMSLIQSEFPGRARARALSAYGVVLAAGATAGLVLGGLLVGGDILGLQWRPVFLVNLPIGVALLVLARILLPANRRRGGARLDIPGLLLGASAVLLIMAPLVLGPADGWPVGELACIPLGIAVGAVFLRVESRAAARGGAPLLNPAVFRAPGFASGLATLAFMQVAYGGFLFVFTLHLEVVRHLSAIAVGILYLPMALAFGASGMSWRRLPVRLQSYLAPTGLLLAAVGYVGSTAAVGAPGWLEPSLAILGLGLGLSASPVISQTLQAVAVTRAADASGALTTIVQLGQAVGIAVVGAVALTIPAAWFATVGGVLAVLAMLGVVASVPLVRRLRRASVDRVE